MKSQIIRICIVAAVDVGIFLSVGLLLFNPFFGLYFVPFLISLTFLSLLFLVTTVLIVRYGRNTTPNFAEYAIYYLSGLLVAGLFLFARDAIPSRIYRLRQEKQNQSIAIAKSDIFQDIVVGKPTYYAEKYGANKSFDEYNFIIEIPITVSKTFTETQILNAFHLTFLSQKNGMLPPLDLCPGMRNNRFVFGVADLSKNAQQTPGTYTLKFKYSYSGDYPSNAAGCRIDAIKSLSNQEIVLSIIDGVDLKTFVIDQIEIR